MNFNRSDLLTPEGRNRLRYREDGTARTYREIGELLGLSHVAVQDYFKGKVKGKRPKKVFAQMPKMGLIGSEETMKYETPKVETAPIIKITEREAAELLSRQGWQVVKPRESQSEIKTSPIKLQDYLDGKILRFGFVCCTHSGSIYQQITHLNTFYDICFRRECRFVAHDGDMAAGQGMYKGQENDIFVWGADAQKDYIVANYPRRPGMTTMAIDGNHCESFFKKAGFDLVKAVAREREDIEYLGSRGAFLPIPELDNFKIYLMHGSGGMAYARSYKMQKIIENFPPEIKPQMLLIGHWHCTNILPMYRNVIGVMTGCFESQTPFERGLGLYPEIGGYIIEIRLNDVGIKNNIAGVNAEWIPFYKPIPNDF